VILARYETLIKAKPGTLMCDATELNSVAQHGTAGMCAAIVFDVRTTSRRKKASEQCGAHEPFLVFQ